MAVSFREGIRIGFWRKGDPTTFCFFTNPVWIDQIWSTQIHILMFGRGYGRESWPLKYGCLRYLYVKLLGNDSDQPSSDYGRSFVIFWPIQTFYCAASLLPTKRWQTTQFRWRKQEKNWGPDTIGSCLPTLDSFRSDPFRVELRCCAMQGCFFGGWGFQLGIEYMPVTKPAKCPIHT